MSRIHNLRRGLSEVFSNQKKQKAKIENSNTDNAKKQRKIKGRKCKRFERLNNDEVSMLINLLEESPCLWDVFQKDYSKHDEITDTELASPLDTATDSVKAKIRAQLGRELDKVNKIKSDQSTNELYTSS